MPQLKRGHGGIDGSGSHRIVRCIYIMFFFFAFVSLVNKPTALRMVLLRYGTQKAKVYQRYRLRALSTLGMINPPMSTRHGVTRCTTVRPI